VIGSIVRSSLKKYFGNIDKLIEVSEGSPRKTLYIGLTLILASSILDGVGIGLMIPFVKVLINEGKPQLPAMELTKGLNLWLSQQDSVLLIVLFACTLIASITLKAYLSYTAQCLTTLYNESYIANLRERLYQTYINAPIRFFDNAQMGKITSTMLNEINNFSVMFSFVIAGITSILTLLAYLTTLLLVSWKLTLMVIALIGLVGLGLTRLLENIKKMGYAYLGANQDMSVQVLDTLSGIRIVKTYGAEAFESENFKVICRKVERLTNEIIRKQNLIDPLTEWATLVMAMVILAASYALLISNGSLAPSELSIFMLALIRLIPVTKRINACRGYVQGNLATLNEIAQGLELEDKYAVISGNVPFTGLEKGISFCDVRFSYNDKDEVLRGFNLEIPKGKTIALVGSSGAGKSTLASLIPRLYDISSGIIEIDGQDIRDFELASLRQHIGIVSQDTYVFSNSIRDNIAYGLRDVSDEQVIEAARLANAHEFISDLPDGYDTKVGDRGVQLSGGQRQRVSIARAILRDPEILILDEATSALDSQSEYLVQDAIERLRQNRTVIVIAHRLSTIRNADRIVVLDKGRVVESGGHQELLEKRGSYWSFHNLQAIPTA
jgi:ABC-type multidrug transport system fused ATPase/permease subunit